MQKLFVIGSWATSENLFSKWQDLFPLLLSTNLLVRSQSCVSSHAVSCGNPRCVSDCPRLALCALAFLRKNLYRSLPFVQIRVPRVSLGGIHPVSVLIPSVLGELVATVVCLPLLPNQNCPCCQVRSLSQCVVSAF